MFLTVRLISMIQDCLSDCCRRNVASDGRERKKQQVRAAAFYSAVSDSSSGVRSPGDGKWSPADFSDRYRTAMTYDVVAVCLLFLDDFVIRYDHEVGVIMGSVSDYEVMAELSARSNRSAWSLKNGSSVPIVPPICCVNMPRRPARAAWVSSSPVQAARLISAAWWLP